MRMVHGLKWLLLTLSFSLAAKTLQVDTIIPSVTNGDMTISKNGTGDIVIGSFSGILKATAGVVSTGSVDLTSDVAGILPVANGGTGSATRNYVDLTSSESIAGVKTFTGELKTSSTTAPSVPAPVMTETQRDALTGNAAGDQVYNSTSNALNLYNGSAWGAIGGGGGAIGVAILKDVRSAGTAGGDFTSGTWHPRVHNIVEGDTGIVTLANGTTGVGGTANQFTLTAGTYYLRGDYPGRNVDAHKARLYDVTNSAVVGYPGQSNMAANGSNVQTIALISKKLTIVSTTTYRIEHRSQTSQATDGMGRANSFSVEEVHGVLTIYEL